MRKFYTFLYFIIILSACSTEKNAFLNRTYHYTTTRFNGYFHGKQALNEAIQNIYDGHEDNYGDVLSVFKYGDEELAKQQASLLDRAIKKGVKMVDKHSMLITENREEVEKNKMIDDCYLLIGKAEFFKKDYVLANKSFKYILKNFKKNKVYYEATLYLMQSYYYSGDMIEFDAKKNLIRGDSKFPKKLISFYERIVAQYYIDRQEYQSAISKLDKALAHERSTRVKNRLYFIKGQLYEKIGNENEAAKNFELAFKKALEYELAFNAKLNYALTFQKRDTDKVIKLLNGMIKDTKNKEFYDQIYFVKGEIYKNIGNEEAAVKNYKQSAWSSIDNSKQKALAYLELGNHFFKKKDYEYAQMYYDSSLQTLPPNFPEYEDIEMVSTSLTELVTEINNVELQDSLQVLAKMDEYERLVKLEELIEKIKEKEEQLKEQEQLQAQIALQQSTTVNPAFANKGGGWVFENPQSIAAGNADFIKTWGNIKLEDNWRRSNKSVIGTANGSDFEGSNKEEQFAEEEIPEHHTVEFYLKQIPLSDEQMNESMESLKNSLYKVADIYKFKLNDYPESNRYFERYLSLFNDGQQAILAKYQLYRNYIEQSKMVEADKIKRDIIENHPDSKYASLILNPNKLANEEAYKKEMDELYRKYYTMYSNGYYNQVIQGVTQIQEEYENNPDEGEFDLLKAFAIGSIEGDDAFEKELTRIQTQYSESDIGSKASKILEKMKRKNDEEMKKELAKMQAKKSFKLDIDTVHYYVIIFSNNIVNPEEMKKSIEQFNKQFFMGLELEVEVFAFDDNESILINKSFANFHGSKDFAYEVEENLLSNINNLGNRHFPISSDNFDKLLEYKEVEKYYNFYKSNYNLNPKDSPVSN